MPKTRTEKGNMYKEYVGHGGRMIVDGDNLLVRLLFTKKTVPFSQIASVHFVEPTPKANGSLTIVVPSEKSSPYELFFLAQDRLKFVELYDLIALRIGGSK